MNVWTCKDFKGRWPVPVAATVTAESVEMAIHWLEKALADAGLPQTIKPEQLIPLSLSTRNVRILSDGDY